MESGGFYMVTVQQTPTSRFTAKGVVEKGNGYIRMMHPEIVTQDVLGRHITNPPESRIFRFENIVSIMTVPMIGTNPGSRIGEYLSRA
jgi:hypothetical protein